MPLAKINSEDWLLFKKRYAQGKYRNQRFGQAFVNTFYPESGEETAKLFYEPSIKETINMIEQLGLIEY